uniref:Mitochondrial poly(A) polymerase n=1 Tax=Oncorhynchus tshawytscha TaxID=74940 RepID=A0AAZ3SHI3_ONCTS
LIYLARWIRPTFPLEPKEGDKYFYTLQEERIEQAERSVLISRPAKTNNKKLLKYLSRHGNINTFYIICKYFSSLAELVKVVSFLCECFECHSDFQKCTQRPRRLKDAGLCTFVYFRVYAVGISFSAFGPPSSLAYSLRYQTKRSASERRRPRTSLGPGCVGVQKILNARCPLVRFTHRPLRVPVVAMNSSEFLYLYGRLDRRVRCLVFSVQCWACLGPQYHQLYAWITNFSLTQRRTVPILLTLDHLKELAGRHRPTHPHPQASPNCPPWTQLLQEFFEFYGTFTFGRMSMHNRKVTGLSLHIQNPFKPALNVSKHVNRTQPEHFVALSRESAWMMQQREFKVPHSSGSNGTGTGNNAPWGLAVLLMPSVSQAASKRLEILLESLKNREEKKMGNSINTTRKKS